MKCEFLVNPGWLRRFKIRNGIRFKSISIRLLEMQLPKDSEEKLQEETE